ncbi:UDP-galactose transporter [Trypanosoma brucei equiperdum]|uniref:UDP-galactose transporter n=1 Tax=Trypanosoma brucei equiperdum TaxID=630700 RepID=A0A3L6L8W9_9TRYP|nr:UDP-galactose transporter [Trypanosoma brucei equiperdum]
MTARDGAAEVMASIVVYSIFSTVMTITNKLLVANYALNYPMGIIFVESGTALLFAVMGKMMGWVYYPNFCSRVARKWLPLTLFFVAMLWSSIKSLETMSVAMHTIMKNIAVVLTAIGDSQLYGTRVTPVMYLAFFFMSAGSYLCAMGDQWVTTWGMIWTTLNIMATVGYTLYMKRLLGDVSKTIGRYGPVFYNNLLSMLVAFVIALPSMGSMIHTIRSISLPPLLALTVAGTGPLLTFATFWCMEQTTPTTFSVVGVVNKVPMSVAGMVVFNQFPTKTGYVGITLGLVGGVIYGCASRERDSGRVGPLLHVAGFSVWGRNTPLLTSSGKYEGRSRSEETI